MTLVLCLVGCTKQKEEIWGFTFFPDLVYQMPTNQDGYVCATQERLFLKDGDIEFLVLTDRRGNRSLFDSRWVQRWGETNWRISSMYVLPNQALGPVTVTTNGTKLEIFQGTNHLHTILWK